MAYAPSRATASRRLSFASPTGSFATIHTPLFHGGNLFQIQTNPTNITFTAAASLADLAVTAVTASPNLVQTGQDLTVNYTVQNTGNATSVSSWVDSVFLSSSGKIDATSVLLGRVTHSGIVAADFAATRGT